MSNSSITETLERHQIAIYLGGLVAGAAAGLAWPAGGPTWEAAIYPVLGALLYATFLQVPFTKLTAAFRDGRFLGAPSCWSTSSSCRWWWPP